MERRPEKELMDDEANARAYALADFAEPHERFVDLFAACFPSLVPRQVLDLGCGPADVSLRFVRRFPSARLLGVDGSAAMLALGHAAIAAAGLSSRIQLQQCYLPHEPLLAGEFDCVISNSLLHHMAQAEDFWQSVKQYAQAGAAVFVMDLMRPANEDQLETLVTKYAADASDVLREDFRNSLYAAYTPEEVAKQLAAAGLTQMQVEPCSDRHLMVFGVLG